MPRTLSTTALEAAHDEITDEVWLVLVTISHPSISPPIRVVNDVASIVSRGNEFIGLPFEIELPSVNGDTPGEARLSVDNVDLEIVRAIRTIQSPPKVLIEVILGDTPDVVEMAVPELTMREVRYDASRVTGSLRFEDITTEPLCDIATPQRLPALF